MILKGLKTIMKQNTPSFSVVNRTLSLLLASGLLTLPLLLNGCERMESIKQHLMGQSDHEEEDHYPAFNQEKPSETSTENSQNAAITPTAAKMPSKETQKEVPLSSDILRQLKDVMDQKITEKVDAEVKKQIKEQITLLEKKMVMPQSSSMDTSSKERSSGQGALDFKRGFADVASRAIPAVVSIFATQVIDQKNNDMSKMGPGLGMPLDELFKDFFDQMDRPKRVQSVGSGFIVSLNDKEAFIVTNNHVVADGKKITVVLADKTEMDAIVHGTDERTDLAVLRVKLESLPTEKREKLSTLSWGSSDEATVGQFVMAIGNPFGLGSTVTSGIISSKGRDIVLRPKSKATDLVDDLIQHDASINMGNSGGVLLDTDGNIIGVNTAIFSPSGGSIGIGFAIPSSIAKSTVDQLIEHGRTKRGWLGVQVLAVSPEIAESLGLGDIRGGIVKGVTKDGPADKAGFKERDIIIEFDEKKLGENQRLTRVVGEASVGKTAPVKILRDGKEMTLSVTVGEYPANLTMEDAKKQTLQTPPEKVVDVLGMSLADLPKSVIDHSFEEGGLMGLGKSKDQTLKGGALILNVKENSSAEDAGLKKGDIITEVNMKAVSKPQEVDEHVKNIKKDDPKRPSILLTVVRSGLPSQYVALQFESIAETASKNEKESKASHIIKNTDKTQVKDDSKTKNQAKKPHEKPEEKEKNKEKSSEHDDKMKEKEAIKDETSAPEKKNDHHQKSDDKDMQESSSKISQHLREEQGKDFDKAPKELRDE